MTVALAVLAEAEKQAKPTRELEAEAKRAYESLVAALHGAGYLAEYLDVFPQPTNETKH